MVVVMVSSENMIRMIGVVGKDPGEAIKLARDNGIARSHPGLRLITKPDHVKGYVFLKIIIPDNFDSLDEHLVTAVKIAMKTQIDTQNTVTITLVQTTPEAWVDRKTGKSYILIPVE